MNMPAKPLPKAPLRNRIRFMCEKMGWRDGAIGSRVAMSAEEVRAFRRLHRIVHKSETPEAIARAVEQAMSKAERRKLLEATRRNIRDEVLRAERERRRATVALDRWGPLLQGNKFEDIGEVEPAIGRRMSRPDSSAGLGASSMAYI